MRALHFGHIFVEGAVGTGADGCAITDRSLGRSPSTAMMEVSDTRRGVGNKNLTRQVGQAAFLPLSLTSNRNL
jgi:hypothetical protein